MEYGKKLKRHEERWVQEVEEMAVTKNLGEGEDVFSQPEKVS